MNQENMNDEMEIDLLDLAYMLLDHWHYLPGLSACRSTGI